LFLLPRFAALVQLTLLSLLRIHTDKAISAMTQPAKAA